MANPPAPRTENGAPALLRRLPIGAEVQPGGGVHFRVWAPDVTAVAVEWESAEGEPALELQRDAEGYFSGLARAARAGWRYRLRTPAGAFPDPASRFQPEGPHGPSEVIDPTAYAWTDQTWKGRSAEELVLYELHLGTFTRAGTWRAAMDALPALQDVGVTAIEIMPIADFSGNFGWGYDGVNLFAPTRLYGRPDDARAFVDRAHELGLMVILDVVYNHLGPDGNYLPGFAKDYTSRTRKSDWGDAINFDGPNCSPVREYFISNARYWIDEFHFDGLRLDATQQIFDDSPKHVLTELAEAARVAAPGRQIYLVGENEPQDAQLLRSPAAGGFGLDALWNDDFHHSAMVAATGRAEAYYSDHRGTPQEFISALKYGFLFQGQWYQWQRQRRGTSVLDLPPHRFVIFLQNHDQLANSLRGERLHQVTSAGVHKALTALLLLAPQTPMLFQGQEFAASTPFLYFADHVAELRAKVSQGRREFLSQFRSIACEESRGLLAEPGDRTTFERCKLDPAERQKNAAVVALHRDLLRIRREDATIRRPERLDGAVLGAEAFVVRFFSSHGDDRLLLVNLGRDCLLPAAPEPLLAPPGRNAWQRRWSSEDPRYGGYGTGAVETRRGWFLPGRSAVLLRPGERLDLPDLPSHATG